MYVFQALQYICIAFKCISEKQHQFFKSRASSQPDIYLHYSHLKVTVVDSSHLFHSEFSCCEYSFIYQSQKSKLLPNFVPSA